MAQFYLDIETTGFDPDKDKVISIQYQQYDRYGEPCFGMTILKEWESSEESIVEEFHRLFINDNVWSFIPIMTNHIFDLTFLFAKFKKYKLPCPELSKFLYEKPIIDIKYMLIMANNLSFKGSGLDQMTDKKMDGRMIPEWYKQKDYDKIEEYIQTEAKAFSEFFTKSLKILSQLRK